MLVEGKQKHSLVKMKKILMKRRNHRKREILIQMPEIPDLNSHYAIEHLVIQ